MDISLTEGDLSQMPPALRTSLLNWQMTKMSAIRQAHVQREPRKSKETVNQLSLLFESQNQLAEPEINHTHVTLPEPENQFAEAEKTHKHVTLTQLCDAGITKPGMPIRVRLKKHIANQRGRSFFNSLEISDKGTVLLENQEFNKPSPLATKINGSPAGGWDYVEVKVDGLWVRLEQLRQTWRQTSSD